jgi:hypothetical protein
MFCTRASMHPSAPPSRILFNFIAPVLMAVPILSSGCLSWVHPIAECDATHQAGYQAIPADEPAGSDTVGHPERVHIFFIHGLDPLDAANLQGVREFCHHHGFWQTTLAQFYHGPEVAQRIRCVKDADPHARILIFGFSAGTCTSRSVVYTLHEKSGIDVDTVIYTSGITLGDNDYSRPDYVGKVIHIRDCGKLLSGVTLSGAENYKYTDVWHFGSPTHPQTLALLLRELHDLSLSIPHDLSAGRLSAAAIQPTEQIPIHMTGTSQAVHRPPSTWDIVRPASALTVPPRFTVK